VSKLKTWGFTSFFTQQLTESDLRSYTVGRIINQEKGGYKLITEHGIKPGQLSGRYEFTCIEDKDFPAVGDWVLCFGEDVLMVDRLLTRQTLLARKKVGFGSQSQILAANLDYVFIVTSLNGELNLRRLERYLALAKNGGITPIVILNKSDLGGSIETIKELDQTFPGTEHIAVSAATGDNMDSLAKLLSEGMTAALVGSSGVGKSTILNELLKTSVQWTQDIRISDDKGRHTTTSRSMFALPSGGLLIDTPGIREVGMTENDEGVREIFADLDHLALGCKFSNCNHQSEPGCSVIEAVNKGVLEEDRIKSWKKMQREQRHQEAARDQRLMSNIKKEYKQLAKRVRASQKKGIF
jgi:ribosome biogenesis GTPase